MTLANDRDIESHRRGKYFPRPPWNSLVDASVAEMVRRHKLDVDVSDRYYELWHEERFGASANPKRATSAYRRAVMEFADTRDDDACIRSTRATKC